MQGLFIELHEFSTPTACTVVLLCQCQNWFSVETGNISLLLVKLSFPHRISAKLPVNIKSFVTHIMTLKYSATNQKLGSHLHEIFFFHVVESRKIEQDYGMNFTWNYVHLIQMLKSLRSQERGKRLYEVSHWQINSSKHFNMLNPERKVIPGSEIRVVIMCSQGHQHVEPWIGDLFISS